MNCYSLDLLPANIRAEKLGGGYRLMTSIQEPASDSCLRVTNLAMGTVLATRLEVADSGPKRNKGLLGRKGLDAGEGLWIIPCESVHTFFMQFSIDLVYLDRRNKIRKVRESVPPWRLSACLSAHSILELPSGTIRATQTQRGDALEFAPATAPDASPSNLD
jgi:uncharacterized membrane protein (UPF0127 family)